ncbi:fatty acid transporter [Hypoxylon sp. NC0597]|nr:fatty acid transporter [Hypoxylon sp. NC0597]
MALTIAGAATGSVALAAYLDARFHIRNDLKLGSNKNQTSRFAKIIAEASESGETLLYHMLENRIKTSMGNNIFLIFEGREWSYTEFFQVLQPVGNWLLKELGIQKGEMVALDGGNSPEYLFIWFALEAIGASVAFINCNLTAEPLVHCVKIAGARYLLVDSDIRNLVSPVEDELTLSGTKTIYYTPEFINTLTDIEPLPQERRTGVKPTDIASLIYTSGTTGSPKGIVVTRARGMLLRRAGNKLGIKPSDRMYTCLPLYHASAQGVCCLPCLSIGATMILSRRFSHKTFWPEVHASRATIIQYVGELCRYLLNVPPGPLDKGHKVRMALGNGLRPDIWEAFRQRFGGSKMVIMEFYASTDGLGIISNKNRGPFSVGAISVRGLLWHWMNGDREARVRIDPDTQEIIRGENGFAIKCKANEPGEMMYRLNPDNPSTPQYYRNAQGSEKRRIADVFVKGDLWFRSGDAMRLDSDGRLFFVDRLGDTFRWHSENVSTTEVGDIVGSYPEIAEANAYGVTVPFADGRAGCVATVAAEGISTKLEDIVNERGLDLKGLAEHCLTKLPRYAVPIFLRIVKQLEYTGTMKLRKGRLRSEGIDLDAIQKTANELKEDVDTIYWMPPGENKYNLFKREDLQEIKYGKVRL